MITELQTLSKDVINAARTRLIEKLKGTLAISDGVYVTTSQRLIPTFANPPFAQIHDPDIDFTNLVQKGQMNPFMRLSVYGYQRIRKDDYALMGTPNGSIGVLELMGKIILALYPQPIFGCYYVYPLVLRRSIPLQDPSNSDNSYYQSQEAIFELRKHINTVQAVS